MYAHVKVHLLRTSVETIKVAFVLQNQWPHFGRPGRTPNISDTTGQRAGRVVYGWYDLEKKTNGPSFKMSFIIRCSELISLCLE